MLWQIFVMIDTNNKVQITVSENCFMSELLEKIKEHPHIPKGTSYLLQTSDGLSFQNNRDDEYRHLSDFKLKNKSTVSLSVGLDGGVWPTMKDLERQPRNPTPSQRIQMTDSDDHPDILGLDDDIPRVIMPCGHAIAPLSLALHCLHELKNNKPEIFCPEDKCNSTWPFSLIREAACLSDEETVEFEQKLLSNRRNADMKQCPNCFVSCHRKRATDKRVACLNCKSKGKANCEFCWNCLCEWKGNGTDICGNSGCSSKSELCRILAECDPIYLLGKQCPSLRVCPNCSLMIQHTKGCKHMTCKRCHFEFCFMCLKTHNWVAQSFQPCQVAPHQTPGITNTWCIIS